MTRSEIVGDEAELANHHFEEGRRREAFPIYKKLAKEGSAHAQLRVGWMCQMGCGTEQSLEEARYWYQKVAETNSPAGQFYLGYLHKLEGQYEKGLECFRKAASQGYLPAMHRLGKMYENGEGTAQDTVKALQYYEQAAQEGHLKAQREIAFHLLRGQLGFKKIPQGIWGIIIIIWSAIKLFMNDPYSDKLRW